MPEPKDLVRPDGTPLIKQPNLIVVKGTKPLPPQMAAAISQQTHCAVIQMPLTSELMMGKVAEADLHSTHSGIHAVLNLPQLDFTPMELANIVSLIGYAEVHIGKSELNTTTKDKIRKLVPK